MAVLSKNSIIDVLENCDCNEMVHPWSDSCFHGNLDMIISALKGSISFFLIMHGAQYLLILKNKKNMNIRQFPLNFIKSLLFGLTYASSFVFMTCFFKRVIGNSIIWFYVVPCCCGLPIFFESTTRQKLTATTFMSMFFEGFYRMIINKKLITRSKKSETILFMLINSLLMYSIQMYQKLSGTKNTEWFLTPPPLKNKDYLHDDLLSTINACSHKNSCMDNTIRDTVKYGSIAFMMSGIRFIIVKLMSPLKKQETFLQRKSFQLPVFISLYVFIFKAVSCFLCRRKGNDCYENTLIAGLLSGASFWFSPNLTILFTALTILLKISGDNIKQKYKIPQLPFTELSFVLSNMFLLQRAMIDPKSAPRSFINILNFVTMKKASLILDNIHKHLGL